jgi:O-phosphoseryl-tRNA(Cys) synthetase
MQNQTLAQETINRITNLLNHYSSGFMNADDAVQAITNACDLHEQEENI